MGLKPKPNPSTTMVSNRMDLIRLTTEDTPAQVDNTTEDRDTISRDTMDSINTTDSTMDSTTDSTTTDSTMDSTTDSTDSKPKAGNYRFTSLSRVTKSS